MNCDVGLVCDLVMLIYLLGAGCIVAPAFRSRLISPDHRRPRLG